MGLCFSMSLHYQNYKDNPTIKDLSYMKSPVQAARYAHGIKNYDMRVGKFIWQEQLFAISDDGFYKMCK